MKTILITGAGSGIGAATAKLLSEQNDTRLILVGRNTTKLTSVLEGLNNPEIHTIASLDISNSSALDSFLSSNEANLQDHPLVAVCANAGIGGPNIYNAADGPQDRWNDIIDTNLSGTYYTCMTSIPWLLKAKQQGFETRHIAITSSIVSRFGVASQAAYVASKTGLLGLVRSLAMKHSKDGLLINAINPGWVNTEMARDRIKEMATEEGVSYESMLETQKNIVPTGRIIEPEEIAALIQFLFSNVQLSITGQAIDINGGAWMG
jgi:NAD(P)-dependent dehydrogenase (short-subunit alcohol dehydrogenase family)